MHDLCFFNYFFQKLLFTENFLIAAINLATRGPLYTCLVLPSSIHHDCTCLYLSVPSHREFQSWSIFNWII